MFCFVLFDFCLFNRTLSQWKEVVILIGKLPHVQGKSKHSYFPRPGQSCDGSWWESNLAAGLIAKQQRRPKQIESQSPLGGSQVCTPPLVEPQTLCRPF